MYHHFKERQEMTRTKKTGKLDEKARKTRRKILIAATRLFARQGYRGTTVTDIAQAIDMTQGALFHHFPNKEALLEAVVKRLAKGFEDYRQAYESPGEKDSLVRVMEEMVTHYKSQPEATVCLAALATEFAGSGHAIVDNIREAYDAFVIPFAQALSKNPGVKDPNAAAIAYIGAVQGIGIQGMLREGTPSLDAIGEGFNNLLDTTIKT
jgi:AcrR family transcriptional regulator